MTALTGVSKTVRACVEEYPGMTIDGVIAVAMLRCQGSRSQLSHDIHKQTYRGILRIEDGRYHIARQAKNLGPGNGCATPEERERLRAESMKRANDKRYATHRSEKAVIRHYPTTAPAGPAETVEEWMARGGHIDVLQGYHYELPPKMPVGLKAYA